MIWDTSWNFRPKTLTDVLLTEQHLKLRFKRLPHTATRVTVWHVGRGCIDGTRDVLFSYLQQCNNPKTKEPKLTAAARIVPEWVEYDNEIKQLLRHVQGQEDTAAKRQTPSASQRKKGEGKTIAVKSILLNFLSRSVSLTLASIFTSSFLSSADNQRDEL